MADIADLPFAQLAVAQGYITQVQLDGVIDHWKKLSRQGVAVELRELLRARGLLRLSDALALAALEFQAVREDAGRFARIALEKKWVTEAQVRAQQERQADAHRQGKPIPYLGDLLMRAGALDREQMRGVLREMAKPGAPGRPGAPGKTAAPEVPGKAEAPVKPGAAPRPEPPRVSPVLPPPPPAGKARSAQDDIGTLDEPAAAWMAAARRSPASFAPSGASPVPGTPAQAEPPAKAGPPTTTRPVPAPGTAVPTAPVAQVVPTVPLVKAIPVGSPPRPGAVPPPPKPVSLAPPAVRRTSGAPIVLPPVEQDDVPTLPEFRVPPELRTPRTTAGDVPPAATPPPADQDDVATLPEMVVPPELRVPRAPRPEETDKA